MSPIIESGVKSIQKLVLRELSVFLTTTTTKMFVYNVSYNDPC